MGLRSKIIKAQVRCSSDSKLSATIELAPNFEDVHGLVERALWVLGEGLSDVAKYELEAGGEVLLSGVDLRGKLREGIVIAVRLKR